MDPGQIPLLAMLRGRASYLGARQRVIAENVANADTPRFAPHDLKPFSFEAKTRAAGGVTPAGVQAVTHAGHMQAANARGPSAAKTVTVRDSETTLDGNSVVLEEEMMMTDSRMNYDAAISFYQKSVDLLRLAIRKPGAG